MVPSMQTSKILVRGTVFLHLFRELHVRFCWAIAGRSELIVCLSVFDVQLCCVDINLRCTWVRDQPLGPGRCQLLVSLVLHQRHVVVDQNHTHPQHGYVMRCTGNDSNLPQHCTAALAETVLDIGQGLGCLGCMHAELYR